MALTYHQAERIAERSLAPNEPVVEHGFGRPVDVTGTDPGRCARIYYYVDMYWIYITLAFP